MNSDRDFRVTTFRLTNECSIYHVTVLELEKMERVPNEAFVTLATNDAYALGALVWAHSLRRVGTTRQLVVMVTNNLSQQVRSQLGEVFDHIEIVNVLDSEATVNLALLTRPDLGVTFTKLHCWRLTQYTKCVFMDADTFVLENIDELFTREELSAAPDVGWPDCFNSGVFVFRPSLETYKSLLEFACQHGSFDGGDQGLLNLYFRDWATKDIRRHLPFIYNCVSSAFYTYAPAIKQFGSQVKVIHFIGSRKPWHSSYNTATGCVDGSTEVVQGQRDFLQLWWNVFMQDVQKTLQSQLRHIVHIFHRDPPPPPRVTTHTHYPSEYPTPQMTAPYQPPAVDVFYELPPPPVENAHEHHHQQKWKVVENRDDREYTHHESFYVEPPMSTKEESVHQEVHDTHCFQETLSTFHQLDEGGGGGEWKGEHHEAHEEHLHHHHHEGVHQQHHDGGHHHEEHHHHHHHHEEHHHHHEEHKHEEHHQQHHEEHHHQHDQHYEEQNVSDSANQDVNTANEKVNGNNNVISSGDKATEHAQDFTYGEDEINVVGGVASFVACKPSYSEAELADEQRQYAWEKGQIDYLGIDSFENIQKQLEKVLTNKTSEPPSFIPSPSVSGADNTSTS